MTERERGAVIEAGARAALAAFSRAAAGGDAFDQALAEGYRLLAERKYNDVMDLCVSRLKRRDVIPGVEEFAFLAGVCATAKEKPLFFGRAIELRPGYYEALTHRGLALANAGDLDGALTDYDEALRLKPDHFAALINRAGVLSTRGEGDASLRDLDAAEKRRPDLPDPLIARGNTLMDLGRLDDAVAAYDRALAIKPNCTLALNNRGIAFGMKGAFARAVEDFDAAIGADSGYLDAYRNRSKAYEGLEKFDKALEDLDWLLKNAPDTWPRRAEIQGLYDDLRKRVGDF